MTADHSFAAPELHEEFPPLVHLNPDLYARAHVSPVDKTPANERSGFPENCQISQVGKIDVGNPISPTSDPIKINIAILALDLGTKTGYALRKRDGGVIHGTQVFTPRASWSPGQKWSRYRAWISAMITEYGVTAIAYEDVKNHAGVLAAHAYGGFLAMLEQVADQHNVALEPVGVGVVKKAWTGAGNADKDMMIAEAKRRGFAVQDDNNADALAILHLAVKVERASDAPMVKRAKKVPAKAQLELS